MKKIGIIFYFLFFIATAYPENGYELWLRYNPIADKIILAEYQNIISGIYITENSDIVNSSKSELISGLEKLLQKEIVQYSDYQKLSNSIIAGTIKNIAISENKDIVNQLNSLNKEGYIIKTIKKDNNSNIIIAANSDAGVLYGTFHLLRLLQTHQKINQLDIKSAPLIQNRILNHWDNLNRTVERGYAGFSIWDWHKLPLYIDQRYIDYARANASIGINGTVLNNVNASPYILTNEYLIKTKALADVFRKYGIKVYLAINFSSPAVIGGLKNSDPLNQEVIEWWKQKIDEIYKLIPDFGGFLVKANSEGQPGPQDFGRTHAQGANMLADILAPKNGIVMWRAFVYDHNAPDDRAKQAYNEFKPLDGTFAKNVLIQVKNGAIDFQPREPFHPLFGAMNKTPLMMEFQITQEYLGQATNLAYLAPYYKECLESDTYASGKGSTVAKVIDGSLHNYQITGIAGVANIGNDINWCGHLLAQSNWYTFGRLAWNHQISSETIADEWIRMTFSNNENVIKPVMQMLMASREAVVNYMTPLGLHHIMAEGHHYGPGPWHDRGRADWTSVYYHKADIQGIGFNRSSSGSNAVSQYFPSVASVYGDIKQCPEKYLLWFHHVSWDYKLQSGNILWDGLCLKYQEGVNDVRKMQKSWLSIKNQIDSERYFHVESLLKIQEKDAIWWKDACLLYFQTFSKKPFPKEIETPQGNLDDFKKINIRFAPGH